MEGDEAAVLRALEKIERDWEGMRRDAKSKIDAVAACRSVGDARSLPRLNALAQDSLAAIRSLMGNMEVLIPQHPSEEASEGYELLLSNFKDEYEALRLSLRSANLRAKSNIGKSANEEREMLLSGGKEGTLRRRNLETQAGMAAAAENVTETLRRTRQLMVQEIDRGSTTLSALDHSSTMLYKTESEYSGQTSLFQTTRRLLSVLTRHDVLDRLILIVGALFFIMGKREPETNKEMGNDWRILNANEEPDYDTVRVMLPNPKCALLYSFPPEGKPAKIIQETWGYGARRDLVDGQGRVFRANDIVPRGTILYARVPYTVRRSPFQPAGAHHQDCDCALVHNADDELIAKIPIDPQGKTTAAEILANKVDWCYLRDAIGEQIRNDAFILPGTKVWVHNIPAHS
ncbi:hypothetical protein SELMODRAFT_420408 [Selaginella moellendorffii]|uniref:Sec20 C-terminal domain-containing protein n=1 Tax=Selaginella moellendorffii TaxID=88036 RepID=D8SBW9_SELML|nr:hypothetical protein SELMODRAFT_420408 [Selaginella moellendorffii]